MGCVGGHRELVTVDLPAERPVYQMLLVQRSRGLDRRQNLESNLHDSVPMLHL